MWPLTYEDVGIRLEYRTTAVQKYKYAEYTTLVLYRINRNEVRTQNKMRADA